MTLSNPKFFGAITTTPYVKTFNATTDWVDDGYFSYIVSIAKVTHAKGSYPDVEVFSGTGTTLTSVGIEYVIEVSNGGIQIKVPRSTPDMRFAGTVLVR